MGLHRTLAVSYPAAGTCLLQVARDGIAFQAGQYMLLGPPGGDLREYSVFSAPSDAFLSFLIRVIPEGQVSPALARLQPGDLVRVEGPAGAFLLPPEPALHRYWFVATGTGIAPFHAMIRSFPSLDYQLLHGVRTPDCLYRREAFCPARHTACLSRSARREAGYAGRVTAYLEAHPPPADALCYLCGSCDMIYAVFAILQKHGIAREQIHAETYY